MVGAGTGRVVSAKGRRIGGIWREEDDFLANFLFVVLINVDYSLYYKKNLNNDKNNWNKKSIK